MTALPEINYILFFDDVEVTYLPLSVMDCV